MNVHGVAMLSRSAPDGAGRHLLREVTVGTFRLLEITGEAGVFSPQVGVGALEH